MGVIPHDALSVVGFYQREHRTHTHTHTRVVFFDDAARCAVHVHARRLYIFVFLLRRKLLGPYRRPLVVVVL